MIRSNYFVLVLGLAQAFSCYALQNQGIQSAPACFAVSGERILGRDMAAAVPELASLPQDLSLGYSPMPGVARVFLVSELQKLASRYGISTRIATPVCFSWPVHMLTQQVIIEALQKALAGHQADLEITDQCRVPAPDGEVVFPIQGLSAESSHSALWNGYVSYSGNRKFSTWVQVRVTVHEKRIVAARAIHPGEQMASADVRIIDYAGPLQRAPVVHEQSDVTGKCARRLIEAGTVISETMLAPMQDVEKLQIVTVHTRCGAAHIETQGIAVEAGYRGDVIKVRNPKSGRVFLAQISDHGVVTVVPGGDVGLAVSDKKS
jgi:flagella basal body P-ring formation protein FlgA